MLAGPSRCSGGPARQPRQPVGERWVSTSSRCSRSAAPSRSGVCRRWRDRADAVGRTGAGGFRRGARRREMSALLARVPRTAPATWTASSHRCRWKRGPGDRLLVRAGETVPVDGIVLEGTAVLDEVRPDRRGAARVARPGRSGPQRRGQRRRTVRHASPVERGRQHLCGYRAPGAGGAGGEGPLGPARRPGRLRVHAACGRGRGRGLA